MVDIKCFHRNDPRRKVKMGVTVNHDIRTINQWKVEELIAFTSLKHLFSSMGHPSHLRQCFLTKS